MQASVRNSEWDEVNVRYGGTTIKYIYRRGPGETKFEPWVVVAPSALMVRAVGKRGLGLYAAKALKRDDYVGQYDGRVVSWFPTRAAALSASETRRLLRRGHDNLITVRTQSPGFDLIDGENGSAPFVQMVNDPRGTALQANAELTDGGFLRVVHARVPAFDLNKTLDDNIHSELRINYGDEYWDLHDLLGNSAEYGIEVD